MPPTSEELIRSRHQAIDVVRFAPSAPRVRAVEDDDVDEEAPEPTSEGHGNGVLFGHFSVFNRWYEIDSMWEGNFLEQIAPGTFEQTFAEDVQRCWFEHGYSYVLDRMSLGSIDRLEEDEIGAAYEVGLFGGLPVTLTDGLAAGEYGASFRMRILEESINSDPGVSEHNPKGIPEVTIQRVQCPEFGPVSIGASPFATANLRATDQFYEQMRSHEPDLWATAARAARLEAPSSTIPTVGASTGGAAGSGQPASNRAKAASLALRLPQEGTQR